MEGGGKVKMGGKMEVEEGRFQGSLRPERWVGLNVSKRRDLPRLVGGE